MSLLSSDSPFFVEKHLIMFDFRRYTKTILVYVESAQGHPPWSPITVNYWYLINYIVFYTEDISVYTGSP